MIPFFENFRNRLLVFFQKLTENKVFIFLCFLLAVGVSFFLGRLSNIFDSRPIFSIEEMKMLDNKIIANNSNNLEEQIQKFSGTSTSTIVASRKGTKYHFVWCKSAASIKESNKIYFKTEDEAKKTGRTLSSSCK